MSVKAYTRGQSVTIASAFTDEDGVTITPTDPVLYWAYSVNGDIVRDSDAMTGPNSDGEWTAAIDTTAADIGIVYWTIRAAGIAKEGRFYLTGNPATPEPGSA